MRQIPFVLQIYTYVSLLSKAKNKQGQYPPAPARLLNVLSFQVQLTRQSLPLATADSPEAWVSNWAWEGASPRFHSPPRMASIGVHWARLHCLEFEGSWLHHSPSQLFTVWPALGAPIGLLAAQLVTVHLRNHIPWWCSGILYAIIICVFHDYTKV